MASKVFDFLTGFHPTDNEIYYSGTGTVTGTIKVGTNPVSRRVFAIERKTGMVVAQSWSDPVTGAYTLTSLPRLSNLVVIAIDDTNTYNAVIKDNITAA